MRVRLLAASGAAAVGLLAAAPAGAAAGGVLTVTDPCVRTGDAPEALHVEATGFAPNQLVTVQADGRTVGATVADASGAFTADYPPPALASATRKQQLFELTASDPLGTVAAPVPVRVSRWMVALPARARPRSRVHYRVYGFEPGPTVYLHIRRRDRTLGSFAIGPAEGPCGNAARRMRYMPLARFSSGSYDYYFQQAGRFSREAPYLQVRLFFFRAPA